MRLPELNGTPLTYCTNIHPGESLTEVRAALFGPVARVKAVLSPQAPFGVGLRLAAAAADELGHGDALARLRAELDAAGLYVFTLNGFPYGAFHGTRVKEAVYRPDWREEERVRYTAVLARVLAGLLPEGALGSISTVPGAFRPRAPAGGAAVGEVARNLGRAAADLARVERETGRRIVLAVEPEPACLLETSADAIAFFREHVWRVASPAEEILRRHLGVCLDTCHASVGFESPLGAYRALRAAGIRVAKIQLSAGLRIPAADAEHLAALRAFAEDVYLHQTVVRDGAALSHFVDLPEALAGAAATGAEWRVHFHVPIFHAHLGAFESTQADLLPLLAALKAESEIPHLEVETYTWDVLPTALRDRPVEDAIVRELQWVRAHL